jgi:succinate-semialdehyde dehydrogenase / glutarate-semialdehyde dehydrogenase
VHAAKGLALVKFLNTGQACISPNRIFVHASIVDAFLHELTKRVSTMKAGSGFDQGVRIGPLVNDTALEKVHRQVQDAIKKGAQLVTGGQRLTQNGLEKGCFYAPTVLTHVHPDMTIYREETFGPVAPVIVYENEKDLLNMAIFVSGYTIPLKAKKVRERMPAVTRAMDVSCRGLGTLARSIRSLTPAKRISARPNPMA